MSERQYIELCRMDDEIRHPDDVREIRLAMNRLGYDASPYDIQWAYSEWSEDTYCAGWMANGWMDDTKIMAVIGYLTERK